MINIIQQRCGSDAGQWYSTKATLGDQLPLLKTRAVSLLCTLLAALSILKATTPWSLTAKAALEHHVLQQPLLVGENEAQQRTSPCWLLHLEKEVIINTLQEPPVLLMACCVVLPIDMVMVEVPWEGEGL